jgi:hypothetical protein
MIPGLILLKKKKKKYIYIPSVLTFEMSAFCPRSVYFSYDSHNKLIVYLQTVLSDVFSERYETEIINTVYMNYMLQNCEMCSSP